MLIPPIRDFLILPPPFFGAAFSLSALSCARIEGRAFRISLSLFSSLSISAYVPCLPSILEKGKRLVGQHGKQAVGVLRGRKLHECGRQLHHEMCLVRAIGRVAPLHFLHNAPRFGSISPSRKAAICSLKSPVSVYPVFAFLPVKEIVARPGRWGLLQSVQTFRKDVSGFPLKCCPAGISLVPCS